MKRASPELAVIGTSAGGLEAVCTLLRQLPADFPLPLLVVQHRSRDSDALCDVLQDCSPLQVHDVIDKEPIQRAHVYLAPPDYHVLVEADHFSLSVDEPVGYSRPSIDVSLESAADAFGDRVIGVVMTGANSDGARGLHRIRAAGGFTLVQDPATAEVDVMPLAALEAVPDAELLSLDAIARRLVALAGTEPQSA